MLRSSGRRVALVAVVALLLGAGAWVSSGAIYDCSAADDRLGSVLAEDPALTGAPAGVERVALKVQPCDPDDGHVEVQARYRTSLPDAEQRLRAAIDEHGWRPRPSQHGASRCWAKETGGTTAYLQLKRAAGGRGPSVVVYADRQGSEWC